MFYLLLVNGGGNSIPIFSNRTENNNIASGSAGASQSWSSTVIRYQSIFNANIQNGMVSNEQNFLKNVVVDELSLEINIEPNLSNTTTDTATVQNAKIYEAEARAFNNLVYSVIRLYKNKEIIFENTFQSLFAKTSIFASTTPVVTAPPLASGFRNLGNSYKKIKPVSIDMNDEVKAEVMIRQDFVRAWNFSTAPTTAIVLEYFINRLALKLDRGR